MINKSRYVLAGLFIGLMCSSAVAEEMRGIIKKVDPSKGELVVEGRLGRNRGVPVALIFNQDTQVLARGEAADVLDLKPGMRAKISYERRDGRLIVTGVSVRETVKKSELPVPVDENTVIGSIARISFTEREIVIVGPGPKGEPKTETLWALPENISITREKTAIKFDDLREGERGVVRTEMRNDKIVPVSVEVGQSASAGTEKNPRLERLRTVLKITDLILEQMGNKK